MFPGLTFLGLNVGDVLNMGAIVIITRPLWALSMGEVGRFIVPPLSINILGAEEIRRVKDCFMLVRLSLALSKEEIRFFSVLALNINILGVEGV